MEPTMISPKVLRIAAAIALLLPMVAPTESFAQNPNGSKANAARGAAVHPGGGMRPGGSGVRPGGGAYHGGGAVIPGAVAGAVVGGAIASQVYGGPPYYGPGYVPPADYYDDSVAAGPAPGDNDAVAYCMQTYRSYDPQSRTYLGGDGQRHPCP
jgi:BA14K-like protein